MTNKKSVKKDEMLMREGEHSLSMFWVQSGQLVVTKHKSGGEDVVLGHIYTGELVGEMSFLDKEPRSASIKAVTDCELVEIPHEAFEKVFNAQPPWFQGLVKTLTERLRKTNSRIRV